MTIITTTCRGCGQEIEPDRRTIVGGVWRLCRDCREGDTKTFGSVVYPLCHKVLQSGKHRGACPGRCRRRNREVAACWLARCTKSSEILRRHRLSDLGCTFLPITSPDLRPSEPKMWGQLAEMHPVACGLGY